MRGWFDARWHSKMQASTGASDDQGFTLVEVMAAGAVLSAIALGLINSWAIMDRMSFDTLLRQKAVFVLNGEMERLTALFALVQFGKGVRPETTGYPAVTGLTGGATRRTYATNSLGVDFAKVAIAEFTASEDHVWVLGTGAAARNYVWLDRSRNLAARISWTECDISDNAADRCWDKASAAKPAVSLPPGSLKYRCFSYGGINNAQPEEGGDRCRLVQLVLEYAFRVEGSTVTPTTAGGNKVLTLSTIVGRRFAPKT